MTDPLTPGLHRSSALERVHWGRPAAEVLAEELQAGRPERLFVITSRSVAATPAFRALHAALGARVCGVHAGVRAHAPREDVIAAAQAARAAGVQRLLAVGGGSVIDATKVVALCLRHGYEHAEQLDPHANQRPPDKGQRPPDAGRWLRQIAVPTTLSGAEFAASAGVTDTTRGMKHAFVHPMQVPQSIVLDPAMTLDTPLRLLHATAMKAIDHAAERLTSSTAHPASDAMSELALRLLREGLDHLAVDPAGLPPRTRLQYGMMLSLRGSADGVAVNVSHALGHVLGAHAGVGHGETTGLLLPAVLRWNRPHTTDAQARIARALGRDDDDAAEAVADLARRLGLPLRLRDVGVTTAELPVMADKALHEMLLRFSRRPVQGAADLLQILQSAW